MTSGGQSLVLKKDGTLVSLAAEGATQFALSNVVSIATGRSYGFGNGLTSDAVLKNDGTVVGLFLGRVEEGSYLKTITNTTTIVRGGAASFALTKDGRVFGMGINDRGQATGVKTTNYIVSGYVTIDRQLLTNVIAVAAGRDMSLALKRDGTVVAWGQTSLQPAMVPEGLSNVVAIAAGPDYCLAITTNRAVAERFMSKGN